MLAIGLMSGTSLDGIDCSLIETDGQNIYRSLQDFYLPYPQQFQDKLRKLLDNYTSWLLIEKELTDYHADCIIQLLNIVDLKAKDIKVIGFHGQTIYHNPNQKITWQIGNPHQLCVKTGIKVVSDFRRRDMAYEGQGAPLIPIFHKVITQKCKLPVVVLNIGGVSNITYIDKNGLIAFDTGPGNAIINDMMQKYYEQAYDHDGNIAALGEIRYDILDIMMNHQFFNLMPPKSLDRNLFIQYADLLHNLKPEDNISTLTKFTISSVIQAFKFLPKTPENIYICGGGLKNNTLVKWLQRDLVKKFGKVRINSIAELGLNPDFVESQGFAYIAVRYLQSLASTFSSTTLASKDTISGVLFTP